MYERKCIHENYFLVATLHTVNNGSNYIGWYEKVLLEDKARRAAENIANLLRVAMDLEYSIISTSAYHY